MGEYVYRQTNRTSEVEYRGANVLALHIVFAFKPYQDAWSDEAKKANSRFRRDARLAVASAQRLLRKRGIEPEGLRYAVVEYDGSVSEADFLDYGGPLPGLISDQWGGWAKGVFKGRLDEAGKRVVITA
jgi:hypothetical protein